MKTRTLFLAFFTLFTTIAFGNNWPQFRGPNSDGIADGATPPLTWSDTKNIKWKVQTPGRGHSSPLISGNYAYMTTAIEENTKKERVGNNMGFVTDSITLKALCVDIRNGKIKWQTELFNRENPQPVHTLNSFATPTPSLDDKNLYCDFGDYGTACVTLDKGEIVWKTRLPLDHEVGPGSSTLLYKNLLILLRDGRDLRYITALNKKTGEEVWKTDRPPVAGENVDFHKSFSSPIIFETDGKAQLVAPCAQWIASYNPDTGKEYWRINHGKGFSLAAQPSVANDMLYFCSGFSGNKIIAVRHDGKGDVTKTHIAWESKKFSPIIPSPVVIKDRIYWVQDSGVACAANAKTGEFIWNKKLPGKHYAAPIIANNRLYLTSYKGTTTVLELGDTFKPLATNKLSDCVIMATPAFVGNAIILRTDKHLYRIEK